MSASTARRFAADVLSEWRVTELVDTVTLLVSELVTNAILHARSDCELVLRLRDDGVRVEVHDRSPVQPGVRRYETDAGTGRGMMLVETLATAWGTAMTAAGKHVWFELSGPAFEVSHEQGVDARGRRRTSTEGERSGGPAGRGPARGSNAGPPASSRMRLSRRT